MLSKEHQTNMDVSTDYFARFGRQHAHFFESKDFRRILVQAVLMRKCFDSSGPELKKFLYNLELKNTSPYNSFLLGFDVDRATQGFEGDSMKKALALRSAIVERLAMSLRIFFFLGLEEMMRMDFQNYLIRSLATLEQLSYHKEPEEVRKQFFKELYDRSWEHLHYGDMNLVGASPSLLDKRNPEAFSVVMDKYYGGDRNAFNTDFDKFLAGKGESKAFRSMRGTSASAFIPDQRYAFHVVTEAMLNNINAAFRKAAIHPRTLMLGKNNSIWFNYVDHVHHGDEEAATRTLYAVLEGIATMDELNSFSGYLPMNDIQLLRDRFQLTDYDLYVNEFRPIDRTSMDASMGPLEVINPANLWHGWKHGNPVDEVKHNKYGKYLEEMREKRNKRASYGTNPDDEIPSDENLAEQLDFGAGERGILRKLGTFTDPRFHYQHLFNRGESEERKQKDELLAALKESEERNEAYERYNAARRAALAKKKRLASGDEDQGEAPLAHPAPEPDKPNFKARRHDSMRVKPSSFFGIEEKGLVKTTNKNWRDMVEATLGVHELNSIQKSEILSDVRFVFQIIAELNIREAFFAMLMKIIYNNKLQLLQADYKEEVNSELVLKQLPYHEEVFKKEEVKKQARAIKESGKGRPRKSEKMSDMYAIDESSSGSELSEDAEFSDEEEELAAAENIIIKANEKKEDAKLVKPESFKKMEKVEKSNEKQLVQALAKKEPKKRTGAKGIDISLPSMPDLKDFKKVTNLFFEDKNGHLKIPWNGDVQKYVSYVIEHFKGGDLQKNLIWFVEKIFRDLQYYVGVLKQKAMSVDFDLNKLTQIIQFYYTKLALVIKPVGGYAVEHIRKIPHLVSSDQFQGGLLKVFDFLVMCVAELKKYSKNVVDFVNDRALLTNISGVIQEYVYPAITKGTSTVVSAIKGVSPAVTGALKSAAPAITNTLKTTVPAIGSTVKTAAPLLLTYIPK
mgnify:CR=1 FL=1